MKSGRGGAERQLRRRSQRGRRKAGARTSPRVSGVSHAPERLSEMENKHRTG